MGLPDHMTCLLSRQIRKEQLEPDMEKQTGSKLGKEYAKAIFLSPCLFNFYAEYIIWNARVDETQARVKISGRNINNFRYADDTTIMSESKEELKSLLMKMQEESQKAGLKLNIQKMKIMASGPITSWQIDGETMETVADFIFLGSRITADFYWCLEIKRCSVLGRKVIRNLDSLLKRRAITLLTKIHIVRAVVIPVVRYGHESWTIKKVGCWGIDAFELWC